MRILHAFQIVILLVLAGCNSIKVISHRSPNADFSKFKTFKTVNDLERPGNKEAYNQYLELDRAIAQKMTERKYSESAEADLGVHYRIILHKKEEVNFDRTRPYVYGTNRPYVTRYTEGVLIIEMRDRQTRKVVWQASLDLRINRRKKLENVVESTVNYIFNQYPFVAGSNKIEFPPKGKP